MKLEASIKERFGVLPGQILSLGASLPLAAMTSSFLYIRRKKHSTKPLAFREGFSVMGVRGIKRDGYRLELPSVTSSLPHAFSDWSLQSRVAMEKSRYSSRMVTI